MGTTGRRTDALAAEAVRLEREGDWEEAERRYNALYADSVGTADAAGIPGALLGQARVWQHQRDLEAAQELAALSLFIADELDLSDAAASAMNTLAVIQYRQCNWDEAHHLYAQGLERALDCGDDATIGSICQNLGVLANIRGDLPEARSRYLEAIASAVRCGERRNAMMAYNNLGMVCSDLGDWMEAEVYFGRGIELAEQTGDREMTAVLHSNRAEPLIRTGELVRAGTSLDVAEPIARDIGDDETLADVLRFRATIARLEGDFPAADALLASMLETTQKDLPLERAEGLEELALLRHAQGRTKAAATLVAEARAAYTALSADRDADRTAQLERNWEAAADSQRHRPAPATGFRPAPE